MKTKSPSVGLAMRLFPEKHWLEMTARGHSCLRLDLVSEPNGRLPFESVCVGSDISGELKPLGAERARATRVSWRSRVSRRPRVGEESAPRRQPLPADGEGGLRAHQVLETRSQEHGGHRRQHVHEVRSSGRKSVCCLPQSTPCRNAGFVTTGLGGHTHCEQFFLVQDLTTLRTQPLGSLRIQARIAETEAPPSLTSDGRWRAKTDFPREWGPRERPLFGVAGAKYLYLCRVCLKLKFGPCLSKLFCPSVILSGDRTRTETKLGSQSSDPGTTGR